MRASAGVTTRENGRCSNSGSEAQMCCSENVCKPIEETEFLSALGASQ